MQGLDWQTVQLPLAAGLNKKVDDRALPPPALEEAIDLEFEESGGIQTRKPYTTFGNLQIATGGSVEDLRRIERYGNELVLFTKDSIYGWDSRSSRWVRRGTHLALSVEESAVFTNTAEQFDADRAELGNMIVYAWTELAKVYVGFIDKTTGTAFSAPITVGGTATRPRLVALTNKILFLWHRGTDSVPGPLVCCVIDPTETDPSNLSNLLTTPVFSTLIAAPDFGSYYDVERIPSSDQAMFVARRAVTSSFTVGKVTEGLAIATSTKARASLGVTCVSVAPSGVAQVFRVVSNGGNYEILTDRISSASLADLATDIVISSYLMALGLPTSLTAAFRTVPSGGLYTCTVFWAIFVVQELYSRSVDTAGTLTSPLTVDKYLHPACRAFDHNGSVFLWVSFAEQSSVALSLSVQLQNTYFLLREGSSSQDQSIHGKAVWNRAGGAPTTGYLPGVSTLGNSVYAWCGLERRVIPIAPSAVLSTAYADRGPVDVVFTFDSNDSRRCAKLGETLYISGSMPVQYDGEAPAEVGFNVYPWVIDPRPDPLSAGTIPSGTYSYKSSIRWENAKGEKERSTSGVVEQVVLGGPDNILVGAPISSIPSLKLGSRRRPALEFWRTVVNAGFDSPFYLVTGIDPSITSGFNAYLYLGGANAIQDAYQDSTLTTKETFYENGGVLENLAPPGCKYIVASDTRLFIAGIPNAPDKVAYSKIRGDGEIAAFNDFLSFDVPKEGGPITALALLNNNLVVFKETAIFWIPGEGLNNLGEGSNFGPPQQISLDVGCRDSDSIGVIPEGLVFQSVKGKYILTRGWSLSYIGAPVVHQDSGTVVACHVVEDQHQIRWVNSAGILMFDYLQNQWAEWSESEAIHATLYQGEHTVLNESGVRQQQDTFTGTNYGMVVETAWIKPSDLQGAQRIRWAKLLGEYRSAHLLETLVYYNYKEDTYDRKVWTPTPTTVGGPYEVKILPSKQNCQAIKFKFIVRGSTTTQAILSTLAGGGNMSSFTNLRSPNSNWTAQLTAQPLGELGNQISITIGFILSDTASIEVVDNRLYDAGTDTWINAVNCLGIKVTGNDTTAGVAISELEDAINNNSTLAFVTTPHATPSALINFTNMDGSTVYSVVGAGGGFHDGAFSVPTGESVKLTGLALEIGMQRGLFKRLPSTQRS